MGRNEEVKNKDPPKKVSIMNVVERTKFNSVFQGIEKYRFCFAGAKWERDCGTSSFANSCCGSVADIWLLLAVCFCSESNDS
jgi:hypothetical protein